MSQKTINIILIILLVGSIVLGTVGIIQASKAKNNLPPGYPPPDKPGLGDALGNIVNNIFNLFTGNQCDPTHPGYTKNGKRNTKCDAGGGTKYCDCSKPGYATDGVADINCEPGHMFYDNDCG